MVLCLTIVACALAAYQIRQVGSTRLARREARTRAQEGIALRRALWIAGSETLRARNCRTTMRDRQLSRTLTDLEVLQRNVADLIALIRPWSPTAFVADITVELRIVGSQMGALERAANGDRNGFQSSETSASLARIETLLSDWAARVTTGPAD